MSTQNEISKQSSAPTEIEKLISILMQQNEILSEHISAIEQIGHRVNDTNVPRDNTVSPKDTSNYNTGILYVINTELSKLNGLIHRIGEVRNKLEVLI